MLAKCLSLTVLIALQSCFAGAQESTSPTSLASPASSTSHGAHNFFFFHAPGDFNRNVFYKNKTEFSLESGWEPRNIPFVYNFATGSTYTTWPLHYTLEPNIASVRWTIDNIDWPSFLRGSTDYTFSGSYVDVARGPESRYFAFLFGIRRNFIRPNWRMVPYLDAHGGIGDINARGPYGVRYAQGQDMTFTLMNGGGIRYDLNPKFSVEAGASYQHVSNFYLSQPKHYDYGINVWGSMIGFNMRLGKAKPLVQ